MNIVDIKDYIVELLEDDSDLSDTIGVKKVYEGDRQNVPTDNYPAIFVEILENDEIRNDANTNVRLAATFAIGCYKKIEDVDSQLTDIMNFEKYAKKALSQDVKLGGNSIDVSFGKTFYDNDFWPLRGAVITFNVLYQQSFTART